MNITVTIPGSGHIDCMVRCFSFNMGLSLQDDEIDLVHDIGLFAPPSFSLLFSLSQRSLKEGKTKIEI